MAVGRLVVCPTPIGNPLDITLRVLDVLRDADVIACEDTRRTGALLDAHRARSSQTKLVSLHEHNERERLPRLLAQMREGATVALASDAGMPLISDPGYPLLAAAIDAGLRVEVLPGPSAPLTALLASGLPPSSFCFVGFLPRSRGEIARCFEQARETLIAFESPRRLAGTLAVLAKIDPQRPAAVCRELTKRHEQVLRGGAAELAEHFAAQPALGEIVLVVGAAPEGAAQCTQAVRAVEELVASGARPRAAAKAVARLTGLSANALYRELAAGE